MSVHGPSRLHLEPQKLLNVDFCAEPYPCTAFPSNANPDPSSKINADPDQQPQDLHIQLQLKMRFFLEFFSFLVFPEIIFNSRYVSDQPDVRVQLDRSRYKLVLFIMFKV